MFFYILGLSCDHSTGTTEFGEMYSKTCQLSINREMTYQFLCTMNESRALVMKGPNGEVLDTFECPGKLTY